MERTCDFCGDLYEPKTKASRFCKDQHRVSFHKANKAGRVIPAEAATAPAVPAKTDVADRLKRELVTLGVFEQYEAAVVVQMAEQLDSGKIVGTAYVSLSKEVDRRVDALRLKAVRQDDPAQQVLGRVEEKKALLHAV